MRLTLNLKTVLFALAGVAVIALSFFASLKAMDWLSPRDTKDQDQPPPAPVVTQLEPLPSVSRSSIVVAPVTISLSAIQEAAERGAARNFAGKLDNPASQVLQNAQIDWSASRGPIALTGEKDMLTLSTPLTGKLNATGSLSSKAVGALGQVLGNNAAKQIGAINIKNLNASAEIKGNVTITSRPKLAAAWHMEPNLAAQVKLGDSNLSIAGAKINVPAKVKPLIDKTVNEQLNAVGDRIRSDPTLRQNAQAQWSKACRSIPLLGTDDPRTTMPPLWLELKPVRAIATQPQVDASSVTLLLGIEAETRITSTQTKPNCPFPDKLSIVPPTGTGVNIAVPIDVPFAEINRIIAKQLVGQTYPEDGSGPVDLTIKEASVIPSGGKLLISLLVRATEKSYFGGGTEATIHIWGRPVLDQAQQTLRLADIQLAVESEAALGLLGAAARTVVPKLQQAIEQKATLDMKPIAANAKERIAAAIAGYQKTDDGLRVEANIDSVTLSDIAFDSNTLRMIAEAGGTLNVSITKLP